MGLILKFRRNPTHRPRSLSAHLYPVFLLHSILLGSLFLLWGLHMVRSGIMRAFGSELRRLLSTAQHAGL